jgi:hypothetical protein
MPLTRIKSLGITDGTIVNADINASAAIATSKFGAGSVLQVVSTTKTDTFSTSSTSFVDVTGLSVSITPTSATSKILVIVSGNASGQTGLVAFRLRLMRDSTAISIGDTSGSRIRSSVDSINADNSAQATVAINFLDSPNTTSAVTYKIQMSANAANNVFINRSSSDTDSTERSRAASTITVMEIAG